MLRGQALVWLSPNLNNQTSACPLKVALDGGTRPGDTLQIHPHFLSLMGDGQANAFRWRDTSPRATLSVVL